jgi:hypothetical protein
LSEDSGKATGDLEAVAAARRMFTWSFLAVFASQESTVPFASRLR